MSGRIMTFGVKKVTNGIKTRNPLKPVGPTSGLLIQLSKKNGGPRESNFEDRKRQFLKNQPKPKLVSTPRREVNYQIKKVIKGPLPTNTLNPINPNSGKVIQQKRKPL